MERDSTKRESENNSTAHFKVIVIWMPSKQVAALVNLKKEGKIIVDIVGYSKEQTHCVFTIDFVKNKKRFEMQILSEKLFGFLLLKAKGNETFLRKCACEFKSKARPETYLPCVIDVIR